MSSTVLNEWQYNPPESVVVGCGSYSAALASILGTVPLPFDELHAGPEPDTDGSYECLLENLKHVLLVVSNEMAAAETLRCHQSLWRWVEKLSSAGCQHDLAFLFVLLENTSEQYEHALAIGLSVPAIHPPTTGHAVWRRSGSLPELLDLVAATQSMDLLQLTARRAVDIKRLALARLQSAVGRDDLNDLQGAVQAVFQTFRGNEYEFDLFCRPPSHRNGNLLRRWLTVAVTGTVTQDWWTTGKSQLTSWLDERLLSP